MRVETAAADGQQGGRGRLPTVVLTGFLGAGKTSLLLRLLGANLLDGTAILVNEKGAIGIDGERLRTAGGEVMDLTGGALCCAFDDEDRIEEAIDHIQASPGVRRLVLETSGTAHPEGVCAALASSALSSRVQLTGIVTVVDARRSGDRLDRFVEARAQVRAADRIALSKTAGLTPAAIHATTTRVAALNERADCRALEALSDGALSTYLWLNPVVGRSPVSRGGDEAHAHAALFALAFVDYAALDLTAVEEVVAAWKDRLVRVKGFIHVAGDARRGFLEHAGDGLVVSWGDPLDRAQPRTELVLIGLGAESEKKTLAAALSRCRANR